MSRIDRSVDSPADFSILPVPPVRDGDAPLSGVVENRLSEAEQLLGEAGREQQPSTEPSTSVADVTGMPSVTVWGVPLAPLSYAATVDMVDRLIERRVPSFFITANLHYARLTDANAELAEVNRQAAFLVADGMPFVWYSRLLPQRLPERVAGSDLVYMLAERAAVRGHRLFLMGGAPGVAASAAKRLMGLYPRLRVVGTQAPELDRLSPPEHEALLGRIREARPDLLLVALGQPKGELWMAAHCRTLGVPACVQVGASFDFVAGRVRRAPRWMQRIGAEWVYRVLREPRRLVPRYAADAWFLMKAVARDIARRVT